MVFPNRSFYGRRSLYQQIIYPQNAEVSEDETMDDDDDIIDPNFIVEEILNGGENDTQIELLDARTTTSSSPPPKRRGLTKSKKNKTIMEVELNENDEEYEINNNTDIATVWHKKDIDSQPVTEYIHEVPSFVSDPSKYFMNFFSVELIYSIVYQTNLYAKQKDPASRFSTNASEIMHLVGACLFMGICPMPSIDDYWAVETKVPQVSNLMSGKRFKLLRRMIHFNDNSEAGDSQDRFYKIRPLYDTLSKTFLAVSQTPKQSVDEVIIAYKGRTAGNLRQYVKSKPHPWGFKAICRASDDGLIHDILLYQGQSTFSSHHSALTEEEKTLTVSSQMVCVLSHTVSDPSKTVIFADNFFSSMQLMVHLKHRGFRYTGTVRENMTYRPPLPFAAEMNKKAIVRGTLNYVSNEEGILVVKWKDNRVVTLISNNAGVNPVSTVKRYNKITKRKEDVPCPNVVKSYNANMGGIDKSDMLVQLYKTPMKSKRCYLRMFAYCIDLSVVNAGLLYRRDCTSLKEKELSLKKFRLKIFSFLSQENPTIVRSARHVPREPVEIPSTARGQRDIQPETAVRYDPIHSHLPTYTTRKTCKHCSRQNNIVRSFIACRVCKVHLCLNEKRNCFAEYHTPIA